MRNTFDKQLELLNTELVKMGALCENVISAAVKALLDNDLSLCEKVFAADSEIDRKEREIEAVCMRLLLQQQPVAHDLRIISSALKMISDMERIGDQASDIAEIVEFVGKSDIKSRIHIKDMATAAIKMVADSVHSFVNNDLSLALSVMEYDDEVDRLFDCVKAELVGVISSDIKSGELCIDLLMIAKYLERIGDHAVNIAEWVEYSITGNHRKA
ncbi:MAG: phosphate signaling complex protein PhoU [Clostridia bacterium]|nr:phosphate signaling complex protein PhoU [Clostridia bacterium]